MMKKNLFVAFLLLCFGSTYGQGFEAYLIGGITFSQIDGDNLGGYNKFGFTAGAATNFLMKKDFSFQQEIVFYQRGSRATSEQINDEIFIIKALNYMDALALINKKINDEWMLQVGLGIGQLLYIKTDVQDNTSNYRSDIFITLGGGYYLNKNLLANVRIQYSVLSAHKSARIFQNNSLNLSLRWRFIEKSKSPQ